MASAKETTFLKGWPWDEPLAAVRLVESVVCRVELAPPVQGLEGFDSPTSKTAEQGRSMKLILLVFFCSVMQEGPF